MLRVAFQIYAIAAAIRQTSAAIDLAASIRTDQIIATFLRASSAMGDMTLWVNAQAVAIEFGRQAATKTIHATLVGRTSNVAGPTMFGVGLEIKAGTETSGLLTATRLLATALRAKLIVGTFDRANAAVISIRFEINTDVVADLLAFWTRR
jgi:hypothetical protein